MAIARSEIIELIEQSEALPDGAFAKVGLLQQAIQMADSHQDLDLQFHARLTMVQTATFSGSMEHAITSFTWCLAHSDADPERFPIESLLWKFKYILGNIGDFPQISSAQIATLFDDMRKRYQENGYSQRPVHLCKARAYATMGQLPQATEQIELFSQFPRDRYADCSACELDTKIESYTWMDDHEGALEAAKPVLQGRQSCAEVPHMTYANLLLPAISLGRYEDAAQFHEKGYRLIAKNRAFLGQIAKHMAYLLHCGNLGKSTTLLEAHLPWALETREELKKLKFFIASLATLEAWKQQGKSPSLHLSTKPLSAGIADLSQSEMLLCWISDEAETLAAQFDARNGNSFFSLKLKNRDAF